MSLLEEISKLTTPAAALPDIEDDNFDDNISARKTTTTARPKFPQINFEEGKYAGKKVSRSEIFGDSMEMRGFEKNEDDDEEEEEDDEEDEEEEDEDDMNDDDEDDMNDDEEEEEEEENDLNDDEEEEEEVENSGITTLPAEIDHNADKAECIQNQRKIWDDTMYTNIRMHALLNASNQMPRGDARKQLMASSDEKVKENIAKTLKNMSKLRMMIKEACECFDEKNGENDDDDEEIPSDEDIGELNSDLEDEDGEDEDEEEEQEKTQKVEKVQEVSVQALSGFLKKHDEDFDKFRATTITKWYNRTKLLNAKSANNADFSVFEKGSILSQITKVLNDEGKLLKKVRTVRSGSSRLGANLEDQSIDNEIFDDNDFYQILLKQMIESRNNSTTTTEDGADMTRSYIELQNMFNNNKKKRDVTSLSSKDRKLKYEPIAKLINFYPANPSVVTWSHESRNELFKSLFS